MSGQPEIPTSRVVPVAPWHIRLIESPIPWVALPLLAVAAVSTACHAPPSDDDDPDVYVDLPVPHSDPDAPGPYPVGLTTITLVVLGLFGAGMAYAFSTLRPLFRERGKISAEVTGRLTEALGGIRVVKSYTAEKREEIVFTKGAHRLFRNIAKSMTGVSATTAGLQAKGSRIRASSVLVPIRKV